eukprot:m.479921 g.479921  ORF g.479921 m.479921 type:complete len:69 (-) comp51094_c0_seq1:156-362(-)
MLFSADVPCFFQCSLLGLARLYPNVLRAMPIVPSDKTTPVIAEIWNPRAFRIVCGELNRGSLHEVERP